MEILACPIDKQNPLKLLIFNEKDEIIDGMLICSKCLRWYPIRNEIPELLPDNLRKKRIEVEFLKNWKAKIPEEILSKGKPYNLKS